MKLPAPAQPVKFDPNVLKFVLDSAANATDDEFVAVENRSGSEHHAHLVECAQALQQADMIDAMDLNQVGKPFLRKLKPKGRELLNRMAGREFRRVQMGGQAMTLDELRQALNVPP
jgi:hypothetical protein